MLGDSIDKCLDQSGGGIRTWGRLKAIRNSAACCTSSSIKPAPSEFACPLLVCALFRTGSRPIHTLNATTNPIYPRQQHHTGAHHSPRAPFAATSQHNDQSSHEQQPGQSGLAAGGLRCLARGARWVRAHMLCGVCLLGAYRRGLGSVCSCAGGRLVREHPCCSRIQYASIGVGACMQPSIYPSHPSMA